ncbi:alpha/beta fold hydrolase [Glycocaulis alkaliphilus]|nr:alpha/beta hydrolase [Glycocaulis alkaliphilus]
MKRAMLKSLAAALTVAVTAVAASAEDRFVVERHGDAGAQTVLFVPGLASSGQTWDGAVGELGETADIHVFTLAGFAGVPAVETGSDGFIAGAAGAISDYIAQGGYSDVVLVGHSLGGQVALQVAARSSDAVSAVMVVDSVPFYARLFNPAATPEQAAASGEMFAAQMSSLPREQFLAMMGQGLPVQSLDTAFHATLTEWFAASDQAVIAAAFAEVSGRDFSSVLEEIDVPVLILAPWAPGAPVDAETLQTMYAAQYAPLENGSVEIVEGARHFLMIDQPAAFSARLARFLADNR